MQQMLEQKHENSTALYIPVLTLRGGMERPSKSMIHHKVQSCKISICVGLFSHTHLLYS